MKIKQALKKVTSESPGRNFVQSVDLIIKLKSIDLSNPENRIKGEVVLPYGRGKKRRICVFSDSAIMEKMEGVKIFRSDKLKKLGKKESRNLSKRFDWFLAEGPLMRLIGKKLGRFLGPLGKMPEPFSPKEDLSKLLKEARTKVRIRVKNQPNLQVPIGSEKHSLEELQANIQEVLKSVKKLLPPKASIGSAMVKLSMGSPQELDAS